MARGDRIEASAIKDAFANLPDEIRNDEVAASQAIGAGIVRALLGQDWFDRYVMPEGRSNGALTIDETTPYKLTEALFRMVNLAEILINLQYAPGFDDVLERMRNGDIEGAHAELDLGRMLFIHDAPFRYVVPSGIKKADYDVEIIYPDGRIGCGDAKCKVLGTQFGPKPVKNALDKARTQLPEDKPGIIFVKIPPAWVELDGFADELAHVATKFLKGTRRIVSVKYYASQVKFDENGFLSHIQRYKEISNPYTRFGDNINWDIFPKEDRWPNGTPPFWQRIMT